MKGRDLYGKEKNLEKNQLLLKLTRQIGKMVIHTLEGDHHASVGDWIITGVNGEQYPCKPDIFAKTYEPVE